MAYYDMKSSLSRKINRTALILVLNREQALLFPPFETVVSTIFSLRARDGFGRLFRLYFRLCLSHAHCLQKPAQVLARTSQRCETFSASIAEFSYYLFVLILFCFTVETDSLSPGAAGNLRI